MFDSLIKSAVTLGSSALFGPAGPIVSSILGDVASSAGQGGASSPQSLLGSLMDPFKMLFPQATSQFPTPFRPTPPTFQAPALGGSIGDLLKSFGDLDAKEASALKLAQSDNFGDQVKGMQDLQKVQRAKELILQVIAMENDLQKKINQNIT